MPASRMSFQNVEIVFISEDVDYRLFTHNILNIANISHPTYSCIQLDIELHRITCFIRWTRFCDNIEQLLAIKWKLYVPI